MKSTGMNNLDKILGGGFPDKTNILVSGAPGTGKTLIGLNFLLAGAKKGEKCCYVSLNENKEGILRACKNIKSLSGIEEHIDKKFMIEYITLGENITTKKFIDILSQYPSIDRLVIDNVNKLFIFSENEKSYRINLSEMIRHLRALSGCTLILCETRNDEIDSNNGEAFECDGVIQLSFLELEEKPIRTLTIHKMRYTAFEPKIPHELIINSEEIKLGNAKII